MKEAAAGYLVVDRDQLADSELQGFQFGGANVCLIFVAFTGTFTRRSL
jgi:hypothetical protein